MRHAYILDAVRTPRGRGKPGKGALSGVHPQELLACALRALAARAPFAPADVDDVVIGCVSQVGEQGANMARNGVLAAGWPFSVSGVSLNRFCASGLQAVLFGAMGVMSGAQELVVAGGVESMSRVPMGSDGGGTDGGNPHLRERVMQVPQGISADLIATLEGHTRADVDRFALRSQERAARAVAEGRFARSLVPVTAPGAPSARLERDETPRAETTLDGLSRLEPSFASLGRAPSGFRGMSFDEVALAAYPEVQAIRHLHTAGNSSQLADGAALVAVASEDYVRAHGLRPRARVLSMATVGSEPVIMLTAPAPAATKALASAKLAPSEINRWEINETFASVVLQTMRALDVDPERVNVNGGAIALGHPLGATGAILVGTAIDELERAGLCTAAVTMCIGGGQGVALVLERAG